MQNKLTSYRLLTPGPVPLPTEVLNALAQPILHHRTPEFEAILQRVWAGLKWIFETEQQVMMLTSTGSGAMEAALVNTLSPGDSVLAVINGKFGERWADMAERFGAIVTRIQVPWGESVQIAQLQSELKKTGDYKALLVQAVETSTATQNPIFEIGQLLKNHPQCLFMVDAITGLGAMTLPMDQWGIDVMVAGSQKAFMLPTGLSFIALSDKAWQAQKHAKMPRYYFDLELELKANKKGQTYFSSANSHTVALDVVFQRFIKRGKNLIKARCEILAEATRAAGQALGLKVYSKSPAVSVTALELPVSVDGQKLRDHLEKKYFVTFMGGQDQLQGKILRIGHLGYITDEDMRAGFTSLAESLKEFKMPGIQTPLVLDTLNHILARGPHAD